MSDSVTDFDRLLLSKNVLARVVSFGVLAPLTVYLGEPATFPVENWPTLLSLFWGFALCSVVPLLIPSYPDRLARRTEAIFVDIESVIAGLWASTFGLDVVCIWAILAAGVYNSVAMRGVFGFGRVVLSAAVGIGLGALWLEFPFEVSMRSDVAIVVLPLFLVFMLVAESKRLGLVEELVETKGASDERARRIDELNHEIREQVLVRYLPADLINDIFEGKISMDTKPHSQQLTVLFSDLSGFTKMSEKHGAEVVSEFLNDYLTIMNETIFANQGTIDKFIGDAIMVIFGAPIDMSEEDQAINAARCAIAMQQGMVLVNQKWKAKGIDEVAMRIGVHQGKAVVGNFGSAQRVDYTAIGPSVNLASRIETACEPGKIYVSEQVRERLDDEPATALVGEFELKGIEGKTPIYELVDWA